MRFSPLLCLFAAVAFRCTTIANAAEPNRPATIAASSQPTTQNAPGAAAPVRIKLPAPVESTAVGGGGRYLILHLKRLQVLAVFDVAQGKLVKNLPMPTNELAFAAGAEKLFVGLKDLKLVQRWDLATLKLEKSAPAPEGGVTALAAGAGAAGPVLLVGEKRFWRLDPETLQATPFPSKNWGTDRSSWGPAHLHVSFDGKTVIVSGGGWAGMELTPTHPNGPDDVEAARGGSHDTLISGDGQLIFPDGNRIVRNDLASPVNVAAGQVFPAHDPAFSLAYELESGKKPTLKLFGNCDPRVLATLHDAPELAENSPLTIAQRVHLVPSLGKLITLGGAADELVIRDFDLTATLADAGGKFLFVESAPLSTATRGTDYSYAMKIRSNDAGVTSDLQAGPPGMKLDASGKLQWSVPADFPQRSATVIVAITGASGHTTFHSFVIRMLGKPPAAQVATTAPPAPPASAALPTRSTTGTSPAATQAKPAAPTTAAAESATVFKLPEPFAEFHAADGGRHLVFLLKRARQLAVYETATGKQVGTIPVTADDAQFTCGRDAIVVALPATKVLQRYDLKTLKRTKSAPMPDGRPLRKIKMGNNSAGPVFLYFGGELVALDGTTLAPWPHRGALPAGNPDYWFDYRVSSDGSTIVSWDPYASPSGFGITRMTSGAVSTVGSAETFSHALRNFTPTADGSFVLYGQNVYDAAARPVPSAPKQCTFVPTSDPRFFIAVRGGANQTTSISLCTTNDRRAVAELDKLPDIGDGEPGEPRVIYLPEEQSVALLPKGNDQFQVRPLTMRTLAVVSLPPAQVAVNDTFTYPIQVQPENATVQFRVESGPPGLTVSPAGVVTWKPTERPVGGTANVILSVTNASGNEVPHTFDIKVTRGAAGSNGPAAAASAPGDVVKVDDHRIELPAGEYRYINGMAGHALVLAGPQLAVLAPDGFTIQKKLTLPKAYANLGERKDYYVGLCQEPRSIDIIDKTTLKVLRTRPVAFDQLGELALHPERPISYVSYAQRGQAPSHRFLIFDENSAGATTDDNWIGQWVAVAPDGKFLLSGFQMTYRRGHDIIDNPDRIWIVPRYGSIDSLARYDLAPDTGLPMGVAHRERVGGNGSGIRLSADGKRATYLSHTGYPEMSGNLGGWDPADLAKLPVTYATKDVASTQELAFHPILPLVACCGKGGVLFFHRETGAREDGRARDDALAGEAIERLYFSPDGRSLLVQTTVNSIRYLNRLPLKLSPEETQAVGGLPRPDKTIKAPPRAPGRQAPRKLPQVEAGAPRPPTATPAT